MLDTWVGTDAHRLCVAIRRSGQRAPSMRALAARLRLPEADVVDLVHLAAAEGMAAPWRLPDGTTQVTLSPLAAGRLRVRLDGEGRKWVRADRKGRKKRDPHEGDGPPVNPDRIADDAPGPLDRVIATEQLERTTDGWHRPSCNRDVPMPTVLLGQRLQWPAAPVEVLGPGWHPPLAPAAVCPGCLGRPRRHEYCLICDTYGLGHLLPPVSAAMRPKVYDPDGPLAGGRGAMGARVRQRPGRGAKAG